VLRWPVIRVLPTRAVVEPWTHSQSQITFSQCLSHAHTWIARTSEKRKQNNVFVSAISFELG
jgi:hypothetical protein